MVIINEWFLGRLEFLDRLVFLDRLEFIDRLEFLDRLECIDISEYLDRSEWDGIYCSDWLLANIQYISFGELGVGGEWW